MNTHFELNQRQLLDVALRLEDEVLRGLKEEDRQLRCLLTYVPAMQTPKGNRSLVLDFGGTNVRAAVVALNAPTGSIEKGPVEAMIPLKRGVPLEREKFLSIQSELLASLKSSQGLPLGYCFSYPTRSTYDGDAVLLKWTKEVFVPDTVGKPVGQLLLDNMRQWSLHCDHVTVINDTIASLIAGLTLNAADAYIGLIVGTGTNMATFIDSSLIPKLPSESGWTGPIPVNLESGNFKPPHLTEIDGQVDRESDNPGQQIFEKAVSGAYLGRILKAAFPDSDFNPDSGSKGVVHLAYETTSNDPQSIIARQILGRSAKLVAASLAGLIHLLHQSRSSKTVRIVAEGSLFWGAKDYAKTVDSTLKAILIDQGLSHVRVEIDRIDNANLLGSAIAALVSRV